MVPCLRRSEDSFVTLPEEASARHIGRGVTFTLLTGLLASVVLFSVALATTA